MARKRKRKWIKSALGTRRRCHMRVGAHHRKRCRVEPAHKGALHRYYGVPIGQKIPRAWLVRDQHAPGKFGQRVRFALRARSFKHRRRTRRRHR